VCRPLKLIDASHPLTRGPMRRFTLQRGTAYGVCLLLYGTLRVPPAYNAYIAHYIHLIIVRTSGGQCPPYAYGCGHSASDQSTAVRSSWWAWPTLLVSPLLRRAPLTHDGK
jgi:hypothetical protein